MRTAGGCKFNADYHQVTTVKTRLRGTASNLVSGYFIAVYGKFSGIKMNQMIIVTGLGRKILYTTQLPNRGVLFVKFLRYLVLLWVAYLRLGFVA